MKEKERESDDRNTVQMLFVPENQILIQFYDVSIKFSSGEKQILSSSLVGHETYIIVIDSQFPLP